MNKENQNINNSNEKGSGKSFDLEKIRKDNPFLVPADYFEKLPGIISKRKEDMTAGKYRITAFSLQRVRPAYYIAAAFIIVIATTMFIFKSQLFNNGNTTLAELSWEEVVSDDYFVYAELSEYNLIEALISTNDYNSFEPSEDFNLPDEIYTTENDSNISSDDIIEYLYNEEIDIDEIYDL